jgi:hypothetical protein
MSSLIAFLISMQTLSSATIQGDWYHTDVRGLEVLENGRCLRLWLEERAYNLGENGASLAGTYRNVIRATPVGAPSVICKYPPPASNPVASQMRTWGVVARRSERGWTVAAEPGLNGGDIQLARLESFATRLTPYAGALVDADGDADDQDKALFFRRGTAPPQAARMALESTVAGLYSGECLAIMTRLTGSADITAKTCDLRARMAALSGRYLSISVNSMTRLDRLPQLFPRPSNHWMRRNAVLYGFTASFEHQAMPGDAIVEEEAGSWRVAWLWF